MFKILLRTVLFLSLSTFLLSAQTPASAPQAHTAAATADAYTLSAAKLQQAIELSHIRGIMHFGDEIWGLLVVWALLALGIARRLQNWAERVFISRPLQGLAFFAALLLAMSLAELPFDIGNHLIGHHYGISVASWGTWASDFVKELGLSLLIGAPLLLLFHTIVRRAPRRYWLIAWIVVLPLMVLGVIAQPYLEPVFNHFEPLSASHPQTVQHIEQLVARTGTQIPPERIFLMKASAKTNGLNAYVSGMGRSKRIVIWDTTLDKLPDDELMFIVGHESGHYVLQHIPKMLLGESLFLFVLFWFSARAAQWLVRTRGARWQVASLDTRAGFLVLILVFSVAEPLLEPLGNAFTRHFEHQADVYGQEAIHGLVANPQQTAVSAFGHLGEAWLEDPNPNALLEFWTYSHPSVQHRARFALQYNPWAPGQKAKYF